MKSSDGKEVLNEYPPYTQPGGRRTRYRPSHNEVEGKEAIAATLAQQGEDDRRIPLDQLF